MIKDYLDEKYRGQQPAKRPDLFLGSNVMDKYLLIEFKRPSAVIDRDDESQAVKYRDELNAHLHNQQIQIMVIGGTVKSNISSHNERDDVKLLSYRHLVADARTQLNWMLEELKHSAR